MNILAINNGHSGCDFYRLQLTLGELERRGHRVRLPDPDGGQPLPADSPVLGSLTDSSMPDVDALAWADVIVGRMLTYPGIAPYWSWWGTFAPTVYDIDDAVFHADPSNPSLPTFTHPGVEDAVKRMIGSAAVVTVPTPNLAVYLAKRTGRSATVLPNCVPDRALRLPPVVRESSRVRVGWTASAHHFNDLLACARPLRQFFLTTGKAQLCTIGYDYRDLLRLPDVEHRPWHKLPWDYYTAIDFDIGIAPLAPGVFNYCKCVDANMRIATNRGLLRAADVTVGTAVWRNGWRRVEAVQQEEPRAGLLITMADGYQLKLTPEHRMWVNGGWLRAGSIKPGDSLAMEPEHTGVADPVQVPWPADGRMSRSGTGSVTRAMFSPWAFLTAPDGPRLAITPRWGRFLGAYVGDGSVGQSTALNISCDGIDGDWIDLLMEDLRAFGLNPSTEVNRMFNGTLLRKRSVKVASAHLLRVMESLGLVRPRANGNPIRVTCVPEVIWRSPLPVIAEFLAGYFEADGSCSTRGSAITASSKDEQLIRDVQRLLLLFGITSSIHDRIGRAQNGATGTYWLLRLRRAEVDVFEKEIGFCSARKQAGLAALVSKPHSNRYRPLEWSREVVSVEPCRVTPVDIQVEGRSFVLAGFVSHNSSIKALEYAARGIPTIAPMGTAYDEFIIPGETGFLVERPAQWVEYLTLLTEDATLRRQMGDAAWRHAQAYTIEGNAHLWEKAYSTAGSGASEPSGDPDWPGP